MSGNIDKPQGGNGDWSLHKMFVVNKLNDIESKVDGLGLRMDNKLHTRDVEIYGRLNKVEKEQVAIKVKSGFWGAITGLGSTVPLWIKSLIGG